MLTVGASSTWAPLLRVSSPSSTPTSRTRSVSHVAASAVPHGKHAELGPPVHSSPRAPLGPSVTFKAGIPTRGTAGVCQKSMPATRLTFSSSDSCPRSCSTRSPTAGTLTRRPDSVSVDGHDEERGAAVTTIWYERDADPGALEGARTAVVGYGNQGRSWALNLRDSGLDVQVCVRADATRDAARADGFETSEVAEANAADVSCLLVPDDVIPMLDVKPKPDSLVVVASGYTLAFDRIDPPGDAVMVAPRMLGPEVRRCYEEGVGFITAIGVHRDTTGTAMARALAVASAIGGLRQGALPLTPRQEAVLDLAVEQALSPALRLVNESFVRVMLEEGIPIEAIITELILSGETERTYRLVRLEGGAAQTLHHSPTSQYGQLTRTGRFDHLDVAATMRQLVSDITSGRFADEWDAERDAGYPRLEALRAKALAPEILAFEEDLRTKLGERAVTEH